MKKQLLAVLIAIAFTSPAFAVERPKCDENGCEAMPKLKPPSKKEKEEMRKAGTFPGDQQVEGATAQPQAGGQAAVKPQNSGGTYMDREAAMRQYDSPSVYGDVKFSSDTVY